MTPNARIAAAIEVLDVILDGTTAEKALSDWGRGHRFAGSKDRAALRDLVFQALRRKRSFAALGGAGTGRGLMLGMLRHEGRDPAEVFTGERFAPLPLAEWEAEVSEASMTEAERLDCPDWLLPKLTASLGDATEATLGLLQDRAPVFLRVNLRKSDREAARAALADEGIVARPHDLSPTALEVTEGERKIRNSRAYAEGLVELQDAASQALADRVPLQTGQRMLDFCAGGGGKTLAVAGRVAGKFTAHDVAPARMKDVPARAARAGVQIRCLAPADLGDDAVFDTVVVDAPCSGSGSWRRDPQGKWALTPERLEEIRDLQARILNTAAGHVATGGTLVYMTCSLLTEENQDRIAGFLASHPDWAAVEQHLFLPTDGGDGFFVSALTRSG